MRGGRGIGRGGLVEAMAWWLLIGRGYRKRRIPLVWCRKGAGSRKDYQSLC